MRQLRSCWNVQQVLASEGDYFEGDESFMCTINKSAHTKKVWKLIVCTSYFEEN